MVAIENLIIGREQTIRAALTRLDETGCGLILLVDEAGLLIRTISDGDLRRLMLAGASLDTPLSVLPGLSPVTIGADDNAGVALKLMESRSVDHVPRVDITGRPCDLLTRKDLCSPILLSPPHLGTDERSYVEEAFATNWIAPLGPNVDAFERELAEYAGVAHAAALSSGTSAIHLALQLVGVRPHDTVFCSSLTFVASANPILYLGATPVFIDSEPQSWNMSPVALKRALREAVGRKQPPRAVIVVNLYGQSADMDELISVCDEYEVPLIEDAAESLGATYKGKASGSFGKFGIYSFNGNKIITTSGGGMLVSDDEASIVQARKLATQGREPAPWYLHNNLAYNYRMSNILAGVGRGQLRVLEQRVQARRKVFATYLSELGDIEGLDWMPEASFGMSTRWLSVCTLNKQSLDVTPSEFIASLGSRNIEARHVWNPMHRQPLFADCKYYPHSDGFSFSDQAFLTGVCLPSGSGMDSSQVARVCDAVRDALYHG